MNRAILASLFLTLSIIPTLILTGCVEPTSDQVQQQQQEATLKEGTAMTGMPAIKNFRERKLLKDILEMRDQEGLVTYTYLLSEQTGKLRYLGESIGYGIPYATQYTSPSKVVHDVGGRSTLPQADPNGLFSPAAAEGTWILLKDPASSKISPVYCEPRVVVSPFPLPAHLVLKD